MKGRFGVERVLVAVCLTVLRLTVFAAPAAAQVTVQWNTDTDGFWDVASNWDTGTFVARTSNVLGLVDEVYDNVPCVACPVTTGRTIAVVAGATTSGGTSH